MNDDTTSTPDDAGRSDQDGRAAVATGEHAAAERNGQASNGSAGAGNGAPSNGSSPRRPTAPPSPRPTPRPDPAAGEEPAAEGPALAPSNGAPGPAKQPPAAGRVTGSTATASEAPTTQMRLPSVTNGGVGAHEAGADELTRPGVRAEQPAPAPGPVPGPGPEADAPPPWQRVPGREPSTQGVPSPRPAGGLLDDEGPTAFLEAPSRSGDSATSTQGGTTWPTAGSGHSRPPRQAALQLKRLDPWSVLKLALVLALVLFFIWMVAVGVLYGVLDGMGVWDRLNGTYADLVAGETAGGTPLISAGRVFVLAAVVGAINSLLFAVAITVGAFVYNVSADLVGGIEVTLSERD